MHDGEFLRDVCQRGGGLVHPRGEVAVHAQHRLARLADREPEVVERVREVDGLGGAPRLHRRVQVVRLDAPCGVYEFADRPHGDVGESAGEEH